MNQQSDYVVMPDGNIIPANKTGIPRKYYPMQYVPPLPPKDILDIGQDKGLQKSVTDFFYYKVLKWISDYKEFYSFKKHLKFLKTRKGYDYVYSLLDLYVKNSVANWYDLRDPGNYDNIKQFIRYKLSEL